MVISFCIPGNEFSNRFLESWTNLVKTLSCKWHLFTGYIPNISYNRQVLLDRAKMIRPTHYMWIDSDQVFKPEDFYKLIEHDKDIVSGIYHKTQNGDYACKTLNMDPLTDKDIENKKELIEVHSNGMGWMLVKSLVYYRMEGRFVPIKEWWEDTSFQIRAKQLGYKSYIDPNIIIGHEKLITI